jgi:hypothetical protein
VSGALARAPGLCKGWDYPGHRGECEDGAADQVAHAARMAAAGSVATHPAVKEYDRRDSGFDHHAGSGFL